MKNSFLKLCSIFMKHPVYIRLINRTRDKVVGFEDITAVVTKDSLSSGL
jgi:hypothetical protein